LLFVAAAAQIETMKTVAHSSGPRGETV
jgi:hypothetical protein